MVTVKVVWKNSGAPVQGSRVCIGTTCGTTEYVHTDANGEVEFDDYNPGNYATIYVDGSDRFTGHLKERHKFGI